MTKREPEVTPVPSDWDERWKEFHQPVVIGDLGPNTALGHAVQGVDIIIHAAARVHVMADSEKNPLIAYSRVNRDGTIELALLAASAGVRRFVYVSSIKVNGEATAPGRPFRADDPPAPGEDERGGRGAVGGGDRGGDGRHSRGSDVPGQLYDTPG